MTIPFAPRTAIQLHEANPVFDQATCKQAIASKHRRLLLVHAVELPRCIRLLRQIHRFRGLGLHPVSELVTTDACIQLGVVRAARVVFAV